MAEVAHAREHHRNLRCIGGGVKNLDGNDLTYGPSPLGWANPDFVAYRRLPA